MIIFFCCQLFSIRKHIMFKFCRISVMVKVGNHLTNFSKTSGCCWWWCLEEELAPPPLTSIDLLINHLSLAITSFEGGVARIFRLFVSKYDKSSGLAINKSYFDWKVSISSLVPLSNNSISCTVHSYSILFYFINYQPQVFDIWKVNGIKEIDICNIFRGTTRCRSQWWCVIVVKTTTFSVNNNI